MDKIAIIGAACLFPGAKTLDDYWQNLVAKKDSRIFAGSEQMGRDPKAYFDAKKGIKDKYYCTLGGYIQDFEFDPSGYAVPEADLTRADKSVQWALQVSREALKDAGVTDQAQVLQQCGAIVGNLSFPTQASNRLFLPLYHQAMSEPVQTLLNHNQFHMGFTASKDEPLANAHVASYPAITISQALRLGGVTFGLDAACATSLYSIKLACDYLLVGKSDLMLAGAVSAADPWFVSMGFSTFKAFPENIASQPLDQHSTGLNTGEGAGMFVLKRYEDAVRDGDRIHAVVDAVGLSNDGKGKFVLSPSRKGQATCYERAYQAANVSPEVIDYIECHATGTPLGDETEVQSMTDFFGDKAVHFDMGSAKSNFGHLLTAAGTAGILKIILGMQHDQLTATIGLKTPLVSENPKIAGDKILRENKPWPKQDTPRHAAISAFGFGGTNAHLIMHEVDTTTQNVEPSTTKKSITPISIVGMGAHFGSCKNLSELENSIYRGDQLFTNLPKNRWHGIEQQHDLLKSFGFEQGTAPKGAYLDHFDFDYLYFKIPPEEQAPLIPQQLLMLKVMDDALKDANMSQGGNVGVIVAMEMDLAIHQFRGRIDTPESLESGLKAQSINLSSIQQAQLAEVLKDSLHNAVEINQFTSFIGNIIPCRLCSLWDFSGPAFTLSSEETSVVKALQVAQLFLDAGDVDAMVVGAVDLAGGLEHLYLQNKKAPFSATPDISLAGSGWSIGEGAGAIVLKREDAAAQDRIYANIAGIASHQSVSAEGLASACQSALQQANVKAEAIDYIEMDGSGFKDLDAAEIGALKRVYQQGALGSIKANIGHTFAASGMAALIKTALCLHQRFIPAIPAWQAPKNPADWEGQPFYFPADSRPWLTNEERRYAAINSLGQDGSSHHMILSETQQRHTASHHYLDEPPTYLFLFPGNTEADISQQLTQLTQEQAAGASLKQLALQQLAAYRKQNDKRFCLAVLAHTTVEFKREMQSALTGFGSALAAGEAWSTPLGSYFTPNPQADQGKIAFVYPGGFNSYIGMAKDIFHIFPELHTLMTKSTATLRKMMHSHYIYPQTIATPDKKALKALEQSMGDDAISMFESGITTSIAYTKIIQNILGVQPKAAFGHSMGELSMLFSSGAWENTDYMSNTLHSTATFQHRLVGEMDVVRQAWGIAGTQDGGPANIWGTYTLRTSPEAAKKVIAEEDRVFLIIVNAPNEIVIAGDDEACKRVVKKLKWRLFPVPIKDVVHNDLVKAEFDALKALHSMPTTPIEDVDFYTAANYQVTPMEQDRIGHNIATFYCQLVDFPRLVNQVYDDGARIFIELGPQSSCTKWVGESLVDKPHLAVGINRKGASDLTSLLRMAAKLTSHGVEMQLEKLFPSVSDVPKVKPSLIKPVVLGKSPMAKAILATDNPEQYKAVILPEKQPTKAPEPIRKPAVKIIPQPKSIQRVQARPQPAPLPNVVTSVRPAHPTREARAVPPAAASTPEKTSKTMLTTTPKKRRSSHHGNLLVKLFQHNTQISRMHADFLVSRQKGASAITDMLLQEVGSPGLWQSGATTRPLKEVTAKISTPTQFFPTQYSQPDNVVFSEQDLIEFAYGKIGKVFGPEYDIIDNYPKRVMLPMDPYLLVTRVTEMKAKRGDYVPSKMTTEYDIPHNAWYSTDGQIPVCICIESGQCDLLLISYMGIDFDNKGEYLYRLLDCTLTFLDDQPKEGQTLRYEISINSFAQHQNNLLFFFSYECFIGDKMILKMDDGCAGFFCEDDLAKGKGVIRTKDEISEREKVPKSSFTPILTCTKTAFDRQDMQYLAEGDLAACFENPAYDKQGKNPSMHFPLDKILMIDRITSVDRTGGLWGLGQITAEKDLFPDEWYFNCHFRDDPVLAGSLMSEGCGQLMQFFMMYLGLHTKMEDARFQTKKNFPQVIRCRGEALPKHRMMTYRLEIIDIGLSPKPYAQGNVEILLEGKVVVDFRNICIELSEKSAEEKAMLAAANAGQTLPSITPASPIQKTASVVVPTTVMPPPPGPPSVKKPALFDEIKVAHFATGDIETCFGPEFAIYKKPATPPRRPPRTPNSYLQLMHRVLEVTGDRHDFDHTSACVAEYDVAPDEWFCVVNSYPALTPYSMLMEIALQPNGFLTSYIGSTLIYPDVNLFFRNLDGEGTLYKEVDLRGKTITNKSTMYATSAVMNNVIQKFTFELLADGEIFYKGTAVFGFFVAESLVNQVGMDKGAKMLPWFEEEKVAGNDIEHIVLSSDAARASFYTPRDNQPYYRLASGMLDFLDEVKLVSNGGQFGKGYVHAMKRIDPSDWFYPCHFHLDPVMPGSLGVEGMIQSMQIFALHQGLGKDMQNPRFGLVEGTANWQYRGQIIPDNKQMTLEVHIKDIKTETGSIELLADGNLWKDGLRIYHVENIGLRILEAS